MVEERGVGLVRTIGSTLSGNDEFLHEWLVFVSLGDAIGWAIVWNGRVRTTKSTNCPIAINVLSDLLNPSTALVVGILDHGIAHNDEFDIDSGVQATTLD